MAKSSKKSEDSKQVKKTFDLRNTKGNKVGKDKDKVSVPPKESKKSSFVPQTPKKPTVRRGVTTPKVNPKKKVTRKKVPEVSDSDDNEEVLPESDVEESTDIEVGDDGDNEQVNENATGNDKADTEQEPDAESVIEDEDEEENYTKIGKTDKKTRKKWPYELEEQLVTLWEEETHLYDASCPQYRRSHLRVAALRRFATTLKMDVAEVKLHMDTLRTTYRKLLRFPSGSGTDHLTIRQQEIMELCKFLKVHLQNRESQSNIPKKKNKKKVLPSVSGTKNQGNKSTDEKDGDTSVGNGNFEAKEKSTAGGNNTKSSKRNASGGDEDGSDNIVDSDSDPAYYVRSKKRKLSDAKKREDLSSAMKGRNEILSNLTSSVENLAQSNVAKSSNQDSSDSFDLWAKLLAEKLRKMQPKSAERFKVHVDTLALDAMDGEWSPPK